MYPTKYHSTACHRHRSRSSAFTLVEVLIVIVIVVVIAAIVIPLASRALDKAKESQAAKNLRSIHGATMLYVADNNGRFPTVYGHNASGGWKNPWAVRLQEYLPNERSTGQWESRMNSAFHCPKVTDRKISYAPNNVIMSPSPYGVAVESGLPASVIRDPARELLLFEAAPSSNVRTGGSFHAGSAQIVSGNFEYPVTVARRHGSESSPVFYGIHVDGNITRFNFNEFARDTGLRRRLFSRDSNGRIIY